MEKAISFSLLGVILALLLFQSASYNGSIFASDLSNSGRQDPVAPESLVPAREQNPPRADAGGDVKVKESDKIVLDGSGSSDPDGDSLTYEWRLLSPRNLDLELGDTTQKAISFNAPSVGDKARVVVAFSLTVSDGKFADSDIARVIVSSADSSAPPGDNGGGGDGDDRNTRTVTVIDTGEIAGKFSTADLCGDGTSAYSIMTAGVKWRTFPVTFGIDATNSHMDQTAAKTAIRKVFATLDAQISPTVTNFRESTIYSSAQIKISWRPMDGKYGQLGYTSYSYRLDTKAMTSATVAFDSLDTYFVSSIERCSASGSSFDLQNIATHELGHAVNLGHVGDRLQSMYPTSFAGETLKRSLGNGDKLGIKSLYG
jgi:hypothetical protein